MTKRKVHAYIDADVIQYRAASFCESDWEDTPCADLGQALWYFDMFLSKWLREANEEVDVESYTLVFTVGKNFRKSFYEDYKSNRKDLKTWPGMWRFKTELLELSNTEYESGLEADDIVGIRVTEDPENRIAISCDKDFKTVPIEFYVPSSHGKTHGEWFHTTEAEADLYWLKQAMIGDVVDNYKGIVGFGPVKADTLLPAPSSVDTMWGEVEGMFLSKGYTKEYALTMARLARILRVGEYDFSTKEVHLWSPSGTAPTATATSVMGTE